MTQSLVILAAGGTGGHVFPAEALANALHSRGHALGLVTDARGQAYGGTLGALTTYGIRAGGIAGRGLASKLIAMAELAIGTVQAYILLKRLAPVAVVGFGGYASFPTVLAAGLLKLPVILHEQNAVLGRANRMLARWATHIATSYAHVSMVPDDAAQRVVMTGMPVRAAVAAARQADYAAPADKDPIRLLVLGGSQGARILSEVIPDAITCLPPILQGRLEISQQCRPEDLNTVRMAYDKANIRATLNSFFTDIPERMSKAHLVITRSGSSTVAELTALGRPAILVPYQHAIDDHQTANALALEQAGGAWCMAQDSFTAHKLATKLTALFQSPELLRSAAEKSRAFGGIDAAERLADLIPTNRKAAP